MRNITLLSTWETWNDFTLELKRRCDAQGNNVLVTLRDGSVAQVGYFPANVEDDTDEGFRDLNPKSCRRWSPSGQCFTSEEWDLIELK